MSKKLLIEKMQDFCEATPAQAGEFVEIVMRGIKATLEDGNSVRIPGFGTFRRVFVDTRTNRNPRTGETTTKLAHHKIKFREERPRTRK